VSSSDDPPPKSKTLKELLEKSRQIRERFEMLQAESERLSAEMDTLRRMLMAKLREDPEETE